MNFLTRVKSAFIDTGYRVLKVLRMGEDDIQEADECAPFGVDANPIKEMVAVYAETLDKADPVIVGYLNKGQLAAPGEIRLYSTDGDGEMKVYTWLKADGTMEIGGDAHHMTQYEALETAFNQLKSDLNAFITVFNTHAHSGGTISGNTGPSPTPGTSSTADITPAKLSNIKTQ